MLGLVKHGRRAHTSSIVTEAVSALGMHLVRGKEGASIGAGGTTKMKVTVICIWKSIVHTMAGMVLEVPRGAND